MADDIAAIERIFATQTQLAQDLVKSAQSDINATFKALANSSIWNYAPYKWELPSQPTIGTFPEHGGPQHPASGQRPDKPTLVALGVNVPNPEFGEVPQDSAVAPQFQPIPLPGNQPSNTTGNPPTVHTPTFPNPPTLLPLPPYALPYPYLTIPPAPVYVPPVFNGVAPDDIHTMTVEEYLAQLTNSYDKYSQLVPGLVQNNTFVWFRAMLHENPNIRLLDNMITAYTTNGGAGIPVPIEEGIITRAVDRVTAENRRANEEVWEGVARRGLTLPSGALMSGLKEARQTAAEATSKVIVDVSIENLKLEHDHMKFMLNLGMELQKLLTGFATDTAKIVLECNAQAIELTKLVLTGMIEANNMMVRVYLAKWEGYKAAVEVFKAQWQAIEVQTRVFEAQIRAELAKTEINKAVVAVFEAVVHANTSVVMLYKAQIDAETAKLEADRVAILGYEASVRAYIATLEGWKTQWDGYRSQIEGQLAQAKVYESQEMGYRAKVEGFAAGVNAYKAQVEGYTAQIEAIAKQNEENLKAYSIELDGVLKAYAEDIAAYTAEWGAIEQQAKIGATITGIQSEFLTRMYTQQMQIEIERSREHLSQWEAQLHAAIQVAAGMNGAAKTSTDLAGSILNSLTTFSGQLSTAQTATQAS
jgi:hypothetical protein